MENRPEFVATWLGLSQLGVIVPLINTNLKKQSLVHSITIASCNGLIFCESLKDCKIKNNFHYSLNNLLNIIFQLLKKSTSSFRQNSRFISSTMTSTFRCFKIQKTCKLFCLKLHEIDRLRKILKRRIITMSLSIFTHQAQLDFLRQQLLRIHVTFILVRMLISGFIRGLTFFLHNSNCHPSCC